MHVVSLATRYFENESVDFDANWYKCSTWQGHETIKSILGVMRSRIRSHEAVDTFGGLMEASFLCQVAFLVSLSFKNTYDLLMSFYDAVAVELQLFARHVNKALITVPIIFSFFCLNYLFDSM